MEGNLTLIGMGLCLVLIVFPSWAIVRIRSLDNENDALASHPGGIEAELRELRGQIQLLAKKPGVNRWQIKLPRTRRRGVGAQRRLGRRRPRRFAGWRGVLEWARVGGCGLARGRREIAAQIALQSRSLSLSRSWLVCARAALPRVRQLILVAVISLAAGCASPASRSMLMPQDVEGVVTLPIGVTPAEVGGNPPLWAMRFVPWLVQTFPPVRMVALPRIPDDNGAAIDGEVWEVVFSTRGAWTKPADFARCFEWQLDRQEQSRAFRLNRQELFELYRQHMPELAQFVLLRRAGDPTRFMAFMLYGPNTGNVPSDQPEVRKFETANPLSRWSAHEVYRARDYLAHPL